MSQKLLFTRTFKSTDIIDSIVHQSTMESYALFLIRNNNMKHFASKEDTLNTVESLGFIQQQGEPEDVLVFLNSPKKNNQHLPIVQISVSNCRNNYWCVDVWGCCTPTQVTPVWNGPRVVWTQPDAIDSFVAWLDEHYPGWR